MLTLYLIPNTLYLNEDKNTKTYKLNKSYRIKQFIKSKTNTSYDGEDKNV